MSNSNPSFEEKNFWDYLRANSYRSERYMLFYVATPKVACTSLKWWFATLEGISRKSIENEKSAETSPDLIIHDTFSKVALDVTGLGVAELEKILVSEAYFKFALVRNPYKRIFSAWQSKLLLQEPLQSKPYLKCDFFNRKIHSKVDISLAFEGFLEHLSLNEAPDFLDWHWTPQVRLLRPDRIRYTKLVKIENAKELGDALLDRYGSLIPDPFSGSLANESLIPYAQDLITDKSVALIQSLYREDFEAFNYSVAPPESNNKFSAEQLETAIKAIHFIRGRHKRFGEMRGALWQVISEQDGRIARISAEHDQISAEHDQMLNSISWKITKPLRYVARNLRKLLNSTS